MNSSAKTGPMCGCIALIAANDAFAGPDTESDANTVPHRLFTLPVVRSHAMVE